MKKANERIAIMKNDFRKLRLYLRVQFGFVIFAFLMIALAHYIGPKMYLMIINWTAWGIVIVLSFVMEKYAQCPKCGRSLRDEHTWRYRGILMKIMLGGHVKCKRDAIPNGHSEPSLVCDNPTTERSSP